MGAQRTSQSFTLCIKRPEKGDVPNPCGLQSARGVLTWAVPGSINQIELHPFHQQDDALEILKQYDVQAEAWGPFAEGRNGLFSNDVLQSIAQKHGKTIAQVVLRWLNQRGIVAIPKSVRKERMAENFAIFDFALDDTDRSGPDCPLSGMLVLDFTRILGGPYCTKLLADLGAYVIKVEPPSGDHYRNRGPFKDGVSTLFLQLNRGKHSLCIDLKNPVGADLMRQLATKCDVLVENFRPGVMERLGLDYSTLKECNRKLVYCSIDQGLSPGRLHRHCRL